LTEIEPGTIITLDEKKAVRLLETGKVRPMDRQSLERKMDQIMFSAIAGIQECGVWNCSPEVRARTKAIEEEIHRLFMAVLDETGSLSDYREAVDRWKEQGTKSNKSGEDEDRT